MNHNSSTLEASLAVAISGLLWGIWWIPLRWLERSALSGDRAGLATFLAAGVVLLPFVLVRPGRHLAGGWPLLLIGLCSGMAFGAWNHALIDGDVVRVTLLFYLAPIWGTGFGALLFRDPLRLLRGGAILLGLSGAAVVLGFEGGVPVPGSTAEWLALASGMLFALGATASRAVSSVGTLAKTFLTCVFGALTALAMLALFPESRALGGALSVGSIGLPLAICLIWQIPVTWLLLWGAARLDAGRVGILLLLEVLAAAASGAILTDEPFGWREAAGCVLIIGAGLVEALDAMRASRRTEP